MTGEWGKDLSRNFPPSVILRREKGTQTHDHNPPSIFRPFAAGGHFHPFWIELRGNITRARCLDEGTIVSSWKETDDVPPKCPACGGLLRPDVVWFGEAMPEEEMQQAVAASTHCDLFFSIGTSTVVYPAAALPMEALRSGATVVEINPRPTPLTPRAHFALAGAAGVVLPELAKALKIPPDF